MVTAARGPLFLWENFILKLEEVETAEVLDEQGGT